MTIKDLINYTLIYDVYIYRRAGIENNSTIVPVDFELDCKVGFCKLNTKFMLAICKDESFSKNNFEVHLCNDGFTSLKKVEL